MLNIDNFIDVPLVNAFSDYDRVLKDIRKLGVNNDNIILCCSMMSCLICSDLKEINRKNHL